MTKKKATIVRPQRHRPSCKSAVALLGSYLSDELNSPTRHDLERHLRLCPDCAAFLATYKKTIEVARSFLQQRFTRQAPLTRRLAASIKAKTTRKSKVASF